MKTYHVAVLSFLLTGCNSVGNRVPPEAAAKTFASTLQLDVQGEPICTKIDSDMDGYVSCTIALKTPSGPPKMMSLQCAALYAGGCGKPAEGCKETVPQVARQGS